MQNPTIFIIRHRRQVNFVEAWSSTPSGDGLHHRTFQTLGQAKAWFQSNGIYNPTLRERPY